MSAKEIIAEIERLPSEEREKVENYLLSQRTPSEPANEKVSKDFKKLADEVFTKNSELFRKLAQ
jgi:hypothetical protein